MKKFLTYSVVIATIFWSLGVSAVMPAAAAVLATYTPVAGDIVKSDGVGSANGEVYYIGSDLKAYLFSTNGTYVSWRSMLNSTNIVKPDYSVIKRIKQVDFAKITLAGNVTVRPGANLLKFTNADTVYAVTPGAKLCAIANSAAAVALYGTNWSTKIAAVPGLLSSNYAIDSTCALTATSNLPNGTLFQYAGNTQTYLVADGKKRAVSSEAFTANGYKDSMIIKGVATTMTFTDGAALTAREAGLADVVTPGSGPVVPPTVSGNLTVAKASDSPEAKDIPDNSTVDFLKLVLTASNDNDVEVTGIKLSAYGLGTASEIDGVTIYSNGVRYGNARDIDSNKVAQINFTTPLKISKGASATMVVKAKVTGTGKYALGVAAAADVTANVTVGGSYPIIGSTMAGNTVVIGKLTIDDEGTLASVKLGDKAATLAKIKMTNDNVEDISVSSVTLKRDSVSTAGDDVAENLKLMLDGSAVATAATISGRYVTFNLATPVTILKNGVKRFTVVGDVVNGAGKSLTLTIDSTADITAMGSYYGYNSIVDTATNWTAQAVSITAGAVSVEKVNAVNTSIKKDTTDNILGTLKVTVNSGKTVELSTLKLTISSTNDPAGSQIENVEVFLSNNNTTYDLTSSTGNGVYSNTNMGLVLSSGVTYEFVVRADTKSTATNGDYTVKLNDAAGGDMVLKETGNDTTVTDITPNSVTLNKVSVILAGVEFSKNVLSAAYSAVIGTSDVEVLNFNIKAGTVGDIKVTQLKFTDANSTATKSVVSEFKLYRQNTAGTYDLVKTVSANDLASYVIAFNDLGLLIAKDTTAKFKLTTSLVNDNNQNGKVMKWKLSDYAAEDTDKGAAVYDTTNDSDGNGIINGAGVAALTSDRSVTVVGTGSLNVSVDNTPSTYAASYQLAGTQNVVLAYFKLKSNNEKIKVTKLNVVASVNLASLVSKYMLVDSAGNEVSSANSITSVTTTLDTDFVVDGEQLYTLKANLNKIGYNEPGAENVTSTLILAGVEAEGYSSGFTLTDGNDNSALASGEIGYEGDSVNGRTLPSLETGFVASKIASVSLVSSYGGTSLSASISSGTAAKVAIIAVTAPSGNTNTNQDGSAIKTLIGAVKVRVQGISSFSGATIERISGSGAQVTSTAASGEYVLFNPAIYSTNAATDFKVNPGETAYFLVRLTPLFTSSWAHDTTLTASLDNLNGTTAGTASSTTGNFGWKDSDTAGSKIQTRILGVSYIDGIGIQN